MDLFGIKGIFTLDIAQALANLDKVQSRMEKFVNVSSNLLDKINVSGLTKEFVQLGTQLGALGLASKIMVSSFSQGFAEIKQVGGEAFDFIGSRAEALGKKALGAGSDLESFRRTLGVLIKDSGKLDGVQGKITAFASNNGFKASSVLDAGRSLAASGVQDPRQMERLLKLAGEMSATSNQPIEVAVRVLRQQIAGSSEGGRALRNLFQVSSKDLTNQGLKLDPGGRLRQRTQNDRDLTLDALERVIQTRTGGGAAAAQAESVQGRLEKLQTQVFLTLGNYAALAAPKVKELLDYITKLVKKFDDLDPATKTTIANFVLYAGAAYAAKTALGPLYDIVTGIASAFLHMSVAIVSSGIAITALSSILSSGLFTAGIANLANYIRNYTISKTLQAAVPGVATAIGQGAARVFAVAPSLAVGATVKTLVPGAAVVATQIEKVGAGLLLIGTTLTKIMAGIVTAAKTVFGVIMMPGMLALLAAGVAIKFIISDKEKKHEKEGKDILDSSKMQVAERGVLDIERFKKLSAKEKNKILKDDPSFLDRADERMTLQASKGMGSAFYRSAQDDEVYANIAKYASNTTSQAGMAHAQGLAPKESRKRVKDNYGNDVYEDTLPAQRKGIGDLTRDKNPAEKVLEFLTGSSDSIAEKNRAGLAYTESERARYKKEHTFLSTEEIRGQQRSFQDENKLGVSSKSQYVQKEKYILKLYEDSNDNSDSNKDAIKKQRIAIMAAKVAEINQKMYEQIDRLRNRDTAAGELSINKSIAYSQQKTDAILKNTISREDYEAEIKRRTKYVPNNVDIATFPKKYSKESQEEAIAFNARLPKAVLNDKLIRTDENKKELDIEKNIRIEKRIANQQESSKYSSIDQASSGDSLGSSLTTLAQKYADETRQFKDNKQRLKTLELQYNLEVKALYMEDYLAWKAIQQEKVDFNLKIKANEKQRKIDRLQTDHSLYGSDNQKEVFFEVGVQGKEAKEKIDKDLKFETEGLNKKISALSSLETNAHTHLQDLKDRLSHESSAKGKIRINKEIAEAERAINAGSLKLAKLREDLRKAPIQAKDSKADIDSGVYSKQGGIMKGQTEQDASDAEYAANTEVKKAEFKQMILEKKFAKAKTPEDIDKLMRKNDSGIKDEYDTQLKLLELKQAHALIGHEGTGPNDKGAEADRLRINNEFAQQKIDLQEKFTEKLKDSTEEMEKQKELLKQAADDKGKFSMGGIYNSYEEAMKADKPDEDLFSQRQNQAGAATDTMERMRAQAKLGVPVGTVQDMYNNPKIDTKVAADKAKYVDGIPQIAIRDGSNSFNPTNFNKDHDVRDIIINIDGVEKKRVPVSPVGQASNSRVPMGE